jgi:parallel beta-helix repeat protein
MRWAEGCTAQAYDLGCYIISNMMTSHFRHTHSQLPGKLIALLIGFFIMPVSFFAQQIIEVSGILEGNTSWTKENIYVVTDNVRVQGGIILHIGSGTLVKFNQGRGLYIEGGRLHVAGALNDTVRMLPNHTGNENWNWAGLTISSINEPDMVNIEYGHFEGAVVAIRSSSGNNILIRNSRIHNNRNIGISLINSSNCLVEHNHITSNFLGMEIYATNLGNTSAFNLVRANRFRNQTTNILLHNDNHGACPFNIFEDNLITGGINGLWLFSSSHGGSGHATVRRNIIYNTGTASDGYGMYISMDSTVVSNNILWQNTTAVDFSESVRSHFLNNSIYANKRGLLMRNSSSDLTLSNNTITGNQEDVVVFSAHQGMVFSRNNVFGNDPDTAVVQNLTTEDIDVAMNFWGTVNDSIIRQLLYDQFDDPGLGLLTYQPILPAANTDAPVSPPRNFTSQIVGNSVRLAWSANPEADVLGYRIYHGEFNNYRFSENPELVFDTVYNFYGISINDPIAVTAIDLAGLQPQAQIKGHESPYAFPTPIPYSGPDIIICENQVVVNINESTIPAQYDSIAWQTSGDGAFNDSGLLRPVYFPGETDIENTEVILTLYGRMNGNLYDDSFTLFIEAFPEVYAGEDVVIPPDSTVIPESAFATNYERIEWMTSGDGYFNQTNMLNPEYFPGSQDISNGFVQLILQAFSMYCGTIADTINIFIRESYTVEGRVWAGDQLLAGNPVIAVMNNEDTDLESRFLTFSDESGDFRFNRLFQGEYLFYAPADTIGLPGFLPTYYAEKNRWQDAYVHLIEGNTYEVDIRLSAIEENLPEGNGSINGHFSYPGLAQNDFETFCVPWFGAAGDELCQDGLSNVSILLYSLSRQKIYGHALTDAKGDFQFSKLPYGTYILEAEIAGYISASSNPLLISPMQESISGVELYIEPDKKISFSIPEVYSQPVSLNIYPNPANEFLLLSANEFSDDEQITIHIYNLRGAIVKSISLLPAARYARIFIGDLKSGTYFGKAENQSSAVYFRFIKQ